jgi:hypothetical protein
MIIENEEIDVRWFGAVAIMTIGVIYLIGYTVKLKK